MAKREVRAKRQDRLILARKKKVPMLHNERFPSVAKATPISRSWMYGLKPVPFNSLYPLTQDPLPNAIAQPEAARRLEQLAISRYIVVLEGKR